MRRALSLEDYRRVARRKLPRVIFDYVDGGAEAELTMRDNRRAFETVTLRPRGGVDPTGIDLGVTVLGRPLSMPVVLAPCGMAALVHPDGDVAGARAARRAGTAFTQSTMSAHSVEDVMRVADGAPVWYQVYSCGGQASVRAAIERARAAKVDALVVTVDTAVGSLRERDRRNGGAQLVSSSLWRAAPHAVDLLGSPRWLARELARGLPPRLMNVLADDGRPYRLGRSPAPVGLCFSDLSWVRECFDGPLVVKGVLTAEDALRSVDEGAAAVVVSNHGGRQLDGADATLRVLPEVVAAVGDSCEVLVDSGVRSGIDVLKALGLGARAVLIGRAWLYGLGAAGELGIDGVLTMLREGLQRNLALLGAGKLTEVDRRYVRTPPEWYSPATR